MKPNPVVAAWALVAVAVVGAGCAASGDRPDPPAARERRPAEDTASPPPGDTGSPVADAIASLPPAAPLPPTVEEPAPTALTIDALDVAGAPVTPVGIAAGGDMEIPGAREVGWYRFGPRPGDEGSAVLAAHIAFDGVDGVFRHLDDLAAGDTVTVGFADGTERALAVREVARYPKDDLPDDVWRRAGAAEVVLITCGGAFDAGSGSYRDNVVAYAVPA